MSIDIYPNFSFSLDLLLSHYCPSTTVSTKSILRKETRQAENDRLSSQQYKAVIRKELEQLELPIDHWGTLKWE